LNEIYSVFELCRLILSSNIWVGTIFWIGVGIFFVFVLTGAWEAAQNEDIKWLKFLLLFFWVLLFVELLAVMVLSFVEIV